MTGQPDPLRLPLAAYEDAAIAAVASERPTRLLLGKELATVKRIAATYWEELILPARIGRRGIGNDEFALICEALHHVYDGDSRSWPGGVTPQLAACVGLVLVSLMDDEGLCLATDDMIAESICLEDWEGGEAVAMSDVLDMLAGASVLTDPDPAHGGRRRRGPLLTYKPGDPPLTLAVASPI